MKKLLLFFSAMAAAIGLMTSCSQEGEPEFGLSTSSVFGPQSRGGEVSSIIDAATAEYTATKYINAPVNGVAPAQPKTASNTTVINNSYGDPVMYAVNFEAGGYVIVSASKKTYPVVASSDQGSYDASVLATPFMSRLIYRYTNRITESFDYSADSLGTYALEWAALLPPAMPTLKMRRAASAASYQPIIDKAIREWESRGLEVYEAQKWMKNETGAYKDLPGLKELMDKLKKMYVNWADGKPMSELSYITVRHNYTYTFNSDPSNRLNTNWTTVSPYNAAVPGGMPLSSEAVALGQILNYFDDPTIYNFSSSSSSPLRNNTEIANFLYDVALNINTVFGSSYSYAPYQSLLGALNNTYKYSYKYGETSDQKIISSINSGSPTIIIDYNLDGKSHAWVCDGYRVASVQTYYELMAPVGQPEDLFGPYEPVNTWDDYGNSAYQFQKSNDNVYFNSYFYPDSINWFYKQPQYVGDMHKGNSSKS